jgi:hypothetical protein
MKASFRRRSAKVIAGIRACSVLPAPGAVEAAQARCGSAASWNDAAASRVS